MPRQVRTSMAGPAPSGADHTVAGGLQRCPDPQILSSGVSSQSFGVDFIEPVVASAFTGSSITVLLDTLNMHIMLDVKDTLLNRTSIRRYEREPIPAETMDFIYRAVANTPTSYNGQQFSVIDIDDQALKETLYELTNQKQLKTCNRLLIFCSDYNKISLLAAKKNLKMPSFTDTMDGVTIGIIDASLAMMSAVVAAESCGLGTNGRSGPRRRTTPSPQGSLRGVRTRTRCTTRASRPEAETARIARVPPQRLPPGQREDGRRTRRV